MLCTINLINVILLKKIFIFSFTKYNRTRNLCDVHIIGELSLMTIEFPTTTAF